MGAGQSSGMDIEGSSMGYQVLRVYPNSPGSRAGLNAYFDFIVSIANTRFNKENGALREILKASVDQKLKMVVFNTRTKSTREVEIIPSTSWGGNGLLGVSIKHSSFDKADERVWHVVEVEPGSPAQQAGFRANEDYVIGSDSILQESDDLYNLIETHEGKALKLFVYNVNNDNCREVICHPNSKWGGKGYLGCEFAHGLLHRIPFGDIATDGDNPRASLLRNEQPMATNQLNTTQQQQQQQQQQKSANTNDNMNRMQNQIGFNQLNNQQRLNQQPGQQLLQQALFDSTPKQQQQQTPLGPPKTFAQLANAQYQTEQYHSAQHSQNQLSQFHMPYQAPNQSNPQMFQQQQHQYQQQQPQQSPPPQPPSQNHHPHQQQSHLPTNQRPLPPQQQTSQQTPSPPAQNFNSLANSQYQSDQYQQQTPLQPSQYQPYQSSIQFQINQHQQLQQQPTSQHSPPPPQQQQQQQTPLTPPQTFAQLASAQYNTTEHYPPPTQLQQQQLLQQAPYQPNAYQQPIFNQSNIQDQHQQTQQIDPALSPNS